jgi:acyl-CoA reductase-like NAD-dependent aldehyde dehydrogenase
LALYIFTKNKATIDNMVENVIAGGVCVNDTMTHVTGK